MLDVIIQQVGYVRCALLVGTTLIMIVGVRYLSFRAAFAAGPYQWRGKPIKSLLTLIGHEEKYYYKRVPLMVAACLAMTVLAFIF